MMLDDKTKVFLLLDEAEKRQKTAEQQQAALQDLLHASQIAGDALEKVIAALPNTVQRAVDSAVPNAMATAMSRTAQTAAPALEKATAGPVERLNQAVTHTEQVTGNIEQASRKITWQWVLALLLVGFMGSSRVLVEPTKPGASSKYNLLIHNRIWSAPSQLGRPKYILRG